MIPTVAISESWKPRSETKAGAANKARPAPVPSAVHPSIASPAARPAKTTAAIRPALTTEGSQRVVTRKIARPTRPIQPRRRAPTPIGPSSSHQSARKPATFAPETATKCEIPALRMATWSEAGRSALWPTKKPASRASAGTSPSTRRRMRRLMPLPAATSGVGRLSRISTSDASTTPA